MSASSAIQKLQGAGESATTPAGGKLFPAGLVGAEDFVNFDKMPAAVKSWNHEGATLAGNPHPWIRGSRVHRLRHSIGRDFVTIAAGSKPCHGIGKPKTNGSIARMQFGLKMQQCLVAD